MATLRQVRSGRLWVLESECLIGRSPSCALQLDQSYVSSQHACVRWAGDHWEARDLGSLNGTVLDGVSLGAGQAQPLRAGARIAFGSAEQEWELIDESAPRVMAVALDGDQVSTMDGEILGLPSSDNPLATIYRGGDGQWWLERQDGRAAVVEDRQTFEVAGQSWRFSCPQIVPPTSTNDPPQTIRCAQIDLRVSRDEEHVELGVSCGGKRVALGSRSHNYVLVVLARHRLADAARDLPDTACGWIYQDDLLAALRSSPSQLNVDIFRIRQQLGQLGLSDAAEIIERRPRTKQLRIGTRHLTVTII